MSAITDEAVLAGLKRNLAAGLRDVIASAATLSEAENLLAPHCGGLGAAQDKARLMRQHLEQEAANTTAATIVGQDPNLH